MNYYSLGDFNPPLHSQSQRIPIQLELTKPIRFYQKSVNQFVFLLKFKF
jgi:hypothetical protein